MTLPDAVGRLREAVESRRVQGVGMEDRVAFDRADLRAVLRRLAVCEGGIKAVAALIAESRGVCGLHLNGDEAPWAELQSGGRYEEWLRDFDAAAAPRPDAGGAG